jgi:hypothetical protein
LGGDEACAGEFLEMMGYGGLSDVQAAAQFTDTEARAGVGIALVPLAAPGQAQEDREPMRMGQRLEGTGKFLYIHISMNIDITINGQIYLKKDRHV